MISFQSFFLKREHIPRGEDGRLKKQCGHGKNVLGMLKLDIFFKCNTSTYTVDFDNGKIKVNQRAYGIKEFTDFLQKI